MNKTKGFLAILACAVIYGTFGIQARIMSLEMGEYQQVAFRNLIACVLVAGIMVLKKQSFSSAKKADPKLTLAYAIIYPLAIVFFTLSVLNTKMATTFLALYAGALVTSFIIGTLAFHEKVTRQKILSILLVLAGIILYASPFTAQTLSAGFLFGILCGICDATGNSLRKFLGTAMNHTVLVSIQVAGGVITALPFMLIFNQWYLPAISPAGWLWGLVFGASLLVVSYLLITGFKNYDLNLGTVVLSSEIFFAILFAWLMYGETLTLTEILGGLLVLTAAVSTNVVPQRRSS